MMDCRQIVEDEVVEKYLTGQLESQLQDDFEVHVLDCAQCLALLETYQAAQTDLAARAAEIRQMPQRRGATSNMVWPLLTRRPFLVWAGLVLLACVAFLVVRFSLNRAHPSTPTQAESVSPATGSNTAVAFPEIATLSADEQQKVTDAITNRRIAYPPGLAQLGGTQVILRSESTHGDSFVLLHPVGELVAASEPTFHWDAMAGATSYSVTVYDAHLNQVQSSPRLRINEWKADRPLQRGQVYQWQVAANIRDGQSVISPGSSNSEAKFRILDQAKADELEQFQKAHPDAHLVLGILNAQAGVLEAAERELSQVPEGSRDYELAQQLLRSLRGKR